MSRQKDSFGNVTYHVGYVRLNEDHGKIPAGMIGEAFIGQKGRRAILYLYVRFDNNILQAITTSNFPHDKLYPPLDNLNYEWSSKKEFEKFQADKELNIDVNVKFKDTGEKTTGALVRKYNTIFVRINDEDRYYKMNDKNIYVTLWLPARFRSEEDESEEDESSPKKKKKKSSEGVGG